MSLSLILLIICVGFCIISFLYFKWYIKNRTSSNGVLKETRIEVKKWINEVNLSIADINTATDRSLRLIEDKIEQLNKIIEDTDKRISVYVKEVEKSRTGEALYTQLGRGVRNAIKTESSPKLSAEKPSLQIPSEPVQQTLPLSDEVKEEVKKEKPKKQPVKKEIREQIEDLAEEGLPPEQIASQLGISIAEVNIAIQLRR